MKKFILDLVDVDRALSPVQRCYRILEGEQMCDGQHTSMRFYLSLPIVLILELGEPEAKDNMWNFPAVLPLTRRKRQKRTSVTDDSDGISSGSEVAGTTDSSGSAHRESDTSEMVYDFVGRVLVGDQHFVARYSTVSTPTVPDVGNSHTPRRNGIWTYNDMEDNCSGFPFREPHARVDTHLYGSGIEAPHGKATHSVVYHLRGGTGTQKKFFERQCTELKHIHKILVHTPPDSDPLQNHIPTLSLNMSTVSMLRTSDIFWRSQNSKYSSAIAEYNSTSFNTTPSPSKSPRKSPKAAKHVSFQLPLESEPGRNTFFEHKVGAPARVPSLTIKIPPQNRKTKSSTHSDLFSEKTTNAAQKDVQPFPDIDTITMKSSSDDPDFSSETKHKSGMFQRMTTSCTNYGFSP